MEASFICICVNEQQQELNQQQGRKKKKKKTTTLTARLGPFGGRETQPGSELALDSRDNHPLHPPTPPTSTGSTTQPTPARLPPSLFSIYPSDPLRWKNGSSVWKLILRARTVPLYFKDVPWKNPPPSPPPSHPTSSLESDTEKTAAN